MKRVILLNPVMDCAWQLIFTLASHVCLEQHMGAAMLTSNTCV